MTDLAAQYEAARQRWKAAKDEMDELQLKMTAKEMEERK